MSMKEQVMQLVSAQPEMMQVMQQVAQQMSQDPEVNPESVAQMTRMFEFALTNPDSYPQLRLQMIDSGIVDAEDLPEQFDERAMLAILAALYMLLDQFQPQSQSEPPAFARGGLNEIRAKGRNGDRMLAHISPFEDRILKSYGGSGAINPNTGLPEYGWLKKTFKKLAPIIPIALAVLAPGVGTAIGAALGASGVAASALGGAVIGGVTSGLAGGSVAQGAALGGLGGGAGGMVGGAANSALGTSLGAAGQNVLGSAIVGGGLNALRGGDVLQGAATGAAGGAIGNMAGGFGGSVAAGGATTGNMLATGYDAKEALQGGALAGLASAYAKPAASPYELKSGVPADNPGLKMSSGPSEGFQSPPPSVAPTFSDSTAYSPTNTAGADYGNVGADYSLGSSPVADATGLGMGETGSGLQATPAQLATGDYSNSSPFGQNSPTAKPLGGAGSSGGFSMQSAAQALPLISMLGGAQNPQQVQQAVSGMTPEQEEYFNRPMATWDWNRLQADASAQGQTLGSYIARNWNQLSSGGYNVEGTPTEVKMARGGALSQVAYLASGGGSGRDDKIEARLSDGEYVMDAETVALLGDGSNKAGAARLDEMRAKIRQQKGKSMAGGKFSSNAKSPLAYLKEST